MFELETLASNLVMDLVAAEKGGQSAGEVPVCEPSSFGFPPSIGEEAHRAYQLASRATFRFLGPTYRR